MRIPVSITRLATATVAAGALLMSVSTGANAFGAVDSARTTTSAEDRGQQSTDSRPLSNIYRGIQGGNLCLLARCTVGDSAGSGGSSQTQGANICLLATCVVRP
ncbi:hypothetical protein DVK44_17860 [Streptomyces paludis]|uniref:Uncharacterized protein n=1 Tax=Streptomyces paludis TaxID=2282738 RepID=A0A345I177_9ACTN|nr:hypothetical protein DVK44_17860 [Streptomyces paludis]